MNTNENGKRKVKTEVKYLCYKCGLKLKAPPNLNIQCPRCDHGLQVIPTKVSEFELALARAYERIQDLQNLNDDLLNKLQKLEERNES